MNKKEVFIRKTKPFWSNRITYTLTNKNGDTLSELCVEEECLSDVCYYIPEYESKKILYITNFITTKKFRNKGYGKFLLTRVINRFKGKYDMLHLNACPYHIVYQGLYENPIFEAPENGLKMDKLIQFYKQAGLEELREQATHDCKFMIMLMKLR